MGDLPYHSLSPHRGISGSVLPRETQDADPTSPSSPDLAFRVHSDGQIVGFNSQHSGLRTHDKYWTVRISNLVVELTSMCQCVTKMRRNRLLPSKSPRSRKNEEGHRDIPSNWFPDMCCVCDVLFKTIR